MDSPLWSSGFFVVAGMVGYRKGTLVAVVDYFGGDDRLCHQASGMVARYSGDYLYSFCQEEKTLGCQEEKTLGDCSALLRFPP